MAAVKEDSREEEFNWVLRTAEEGSGGGPFEANLTDFKFRNSQQRMIYFGTPAESLWYGMEVLRRLDKHFRAGVRTRSSSHAFYASQTTAYNMLTGEIDRVES